MTEVTANFHSFVSISMLIVTLNGYKREVSCHLYILLAGSCEQGASVSVYVEQVLREHLDQYKDDVERRV